MHDWWRAIGVTWTVAIAAGLISALLGIAFGSAAAMVAATNKRGQTIVVAWRLLMLLSLAMPLILHAAAWESTMGKFGWLAPGTFGGNVGWVVWIHGIYGVALVSLTTAWATTTVDPNAIAHAELDYAVSTRWRYVQFPIAWPWIAASIVGVMLIAATEMSVADLFGVRTVADQFYLFHAVDPDSTAVLVTTLIPLVIAMSLLPLIWTIARRRHSWRVGTTTCHHLPESSSSSAALPWWSMFVLLASIGCVIGLPLMGNVIQAGRGVELVDGTTASNWSASACYRAIASAPQTFQSEYQWTLILCVVTATCVTTAAFVLAITLRDHPVVERAVDVSAIGLILIPGPIVGLTVASLFHHLGELGDHLATRTLWPTVLAISCRSGVVAYFICRLGVKGIGSDIWDSSRMEGKITWRIWHVHRPILIRIVASAWLAAAIVSSGDVAAALPVIPPGVTTVGTRLFGLLHSGARYQEAALAFWYVIGIAAACILVSGIVRVVSRPGSPRFD